MFEREIGLIGEENFAKIKAKRVLVFGLGGVGGYVCETLVRSGISTLGICDFDVVSESNKNRQIIALDSTINQAKALVMAKRLKDINKNVYIDVYNFKITIETLEQIDFTRYDYIVDAVDDVAAKIAIILKAYREKVKIISSMGTGNKLDPLQFKIKKINQTKVCPLARVMRLKLKELNIVDLPVLYSEELPVNTGKRVPQSIAFCPSVAGILLARWVIMDIIAN